MHVRGRTSKTPSRTAVVLVEPQGAGNVGAAARAMANMGLSRLLLVRPAPYLVPEAFRMALAGRVILEEAEVFEDLRDALAGFTLVAGTTRRRGAARGEPVSPRAFALEVAGSTDREAAVVFGREDRGLTNEELMRCHRVIAIPVSEEAGSLNLAQSVLIAAYEIHLACRKGDPAARSGALVRRVPVAEEEGLYGHMEQVLERIGYLDGSNPDHMMRTFRRIFARSGLDAREVKALRGIFRQVEWYAAREDRRRGD